MCGSRRSSRKDKKKKENPMPTTAPPFIGASGTSLKYNPDPTASTYPDALAGIRKWSGLPKMKADMFETTSVDAQDGSGDPDMGKYKEFGKIDPGDFQVTLGCDPTQTQFIHANVGKKMALQILFPSGGFIPIVGGISEVGGTVEDGKETLIDVTISLTQVGLYVKSP
jgi:hypothetical protein